MSGFSSFYVYHPVVLCKLFGCSFLTVVAVPGVGERQLQLGGHSADPGATAEEQHQKE